MSCGPAPIPISRSARLPANLIQAQRDLREKNEELKSSLQDLQVNRQMLIQKGRLESLGDPAVDGSGFRLLLRPEAEAGDHVSPGRFAVGDEHVGRRGHPEAGLLGSGHDQAKSTRRRSEALPLQFSGDVKSVPFKTPARVF